MRFCFFLQHFNRECAFEWSPGEISLGCLIFQYFIRIMDCSGHSLCPLNILSDRDRQTVMLFEFCTKVFLNYLCKAKNRILSNFQGLSKKPRQEVHKFILQQHPIRKLLSNGIPLVLDIRFEPVHSC